MNSPSLKVPKLLTLFHFRWVVLQCRERCDWFTQGAKAVLRELPPSSQCVEDVSGVIPDIRLYISSLSISFDKGLLILLTIKKQLLHYYNDYYYYYSMLGISLLHVLQVSYHWAHPKSCSMSFFPNIIFLFLILLFFLFCFLWVNLVPFLWVHEVTITDVKLLALCVHSVL